MLLVLTSWTDFGFRQNNPDMSVSGVGAKQCVGEWLVSGCLGFSTIHQSATPRRVHRSQNLNQNLNRMNDMSVESFQMYTAFRTAY
jgi:hypothetical protein